MYELGICEFSQICATEGKAQVICQQKSEQGIPQMCVLGKMTVNVGIEVRKSRERDIGHNILLTASAEQRHVTSR